MYVFDERHMVPINQVEEVIVGRDHYDGTPCERYIKCANPECNDHMLASEENEAKHLGGCKLECTKHPRNRYIIKHNLSEQYVAKVIGQLETTWS